MIREPVRTCIGCGKRAAQRALVRVVANGETLVPDVRRCAPGRGAYLHPQRACWLAFARRRGPVRSLRMTPRREERERLAGLLASESLGVAE